MENIIKNFAKNAKKKVKVIKELLVEPKDLGIYLYSKTIYESLCSKGFAIK